MPSYFISILIGLIVINISMFFQQSKILFYPAKELEGNPRDWGMSYIDVTLTTEDGLKLNAWYVPFADSKEVVLFFHGNAGNMSHRQASLQIFHDLGVNVLMLDYRGYGKSEGSPDESGLYMDAMTAWNYLVEQKKFKPKEIIIFGRSLGGAVATNLATRVNAAGLILESTFTSARDFASRVFPVISRIVFMRYSFNTNKLIKEVHTPVLVLHSTEDDIVPFELGERVFESANAPKQIFTLRGDHNSGFYLSQPKYGQALAAWLKTLPAN